MALTPAVKVKWVSLRLPKRILIVLVRVILLVHQPSPPCSSSFSLHMETRQGGGEPINLMYQMDPAKSFYLHVTIVKEIINSGSLSVGVVRQDQFQQGYKIRGMFYNGNLTNVSISALKVGWGPYLKERRNRFKIRSCWWNIKKQQKISKSFCITMEHALELHFRFSTRDEQDLFSLVLV